MNVEFNRYYPDKDGKSLVPVLFGKREGIRSSLFTAYRNTVRAVRTEDWKLIRYPDRWQPEYTLKLYFEPAPDK